MAETHRGTPAAQQWWQQAATLSRRSVQIEAFYDNNLLLAQTLEALGQFADAIYYYRASLALREDATEALSNLGRAFLRSNRHREAIPVFQQLIKSQPTNQSAHTLIARAHIYLENYAAAAAAYRHLLQLNPDDNQARYNLGVMYLTLGNAEKARQIYDRLVASKDPLADRLQQLMVRQPSNSP